MKIRSYFHYLVWVDSILYIFQNIFPVALASKKLSKAPSIYTKQTMKKTKSYSEKVDKKFHFVVNLFMLPNIPGFVITQEDIGFGRNRQSICNASSYWKNGIGMVK
jgi:hypothetical protein